jgi:hypothetical protein
MRLGWSIGLPGPFRLSGTIWRSRRRRTYRGTLPGWRCRHRHARRDLAVACAQREARRRSGLPAPAGSPWRQPTVRAAVDTWRGNRQRQS